MTLLGSQLIDVWRSAAGSYVDGRWTPGARTLTQINISLNPLISGKTGGSVERLERETGHSLTGGLWLFTETALQTDDPPTKTLADWVVYRGVVYQVLNVADWDDPDGDLDCHEYFAYRLNPQPTLPDP